MKPVDLHVAGPDSGAAWKPDPPSCEQCSSSDATPSIRPAPIRPIEPCAAEFDQPLRASRERDAFSRVL